MKALVLKDWFVVFKQMKLFILFIAVFSILPGSSTTMFAVIYAVMIPYSALAYDERSKWDQLAAMMPYSDRDVVLGKYVLGWLFTAGSIAIALAAQVLSSPFTHTRPDFMGAVLTGCTGVCIMACILPLMFRFGVERGRMIFIMVVVAAAVFSSSAISLRGQSPEGLPSALTVLLPAAAVLLSVASVPLSVRMYRRRNP